MKNSFRPMLWSLDERVMPDAAPVDPAAWYLANVGPTLPAGVDWTDPASYGPYVLGMPTESSGTGSGSGMGSGDGYASGSSSGSGAGSGYGYGSGSGNGSESGSGSGSGVGMGSGSGTETGSGSGMGSGSGSGSGYGSGTASGSGSGSGSGVGMGSGSGSSVNTVPTNQQQINLLRFEILDLKAQLLQLQNEINNLNVAIRTRTDDIAVIDQNIEDLKADRDQYLKTGDNVRTALTQAKIDNQNLVRDALKLKLDVDNSAVMSDNMMLITLQGTLISAQDRLIQLLSSQNGS